MINLMPRELGWYRYLVYNKGIIGSLFTLIHLPFMLAFLSLVVVGAAAAPAINNTALILSLAVVFLLLYGEHMLDDTTVVGKPWGTAISDLNLIFLGVGMFTIALGVGLHAMVLFDSRFPPIAVALGIAFSVLYGIEVMGFHTITFGSLGMSAIPVSSYLAQVITTGEIVDPAVAVVLGIIGYTYSHVMLALYEHTKTREHKVAWQLLGLHFIMIYTVAAGLYFWRVI